MKEVSIYIDGSCSGNPGPGGWAAVCKEKEKKRAVKGFALHTTNNKMELAAAVGAIKALKCPCLINLYTDSAYLVTCSNHDNAWLTKDDRANRELWMEFLQAAEQGKHTVVFIKVAGHAGVELNELADRLAKEQCRKAKHLAYGKRRV